MQNTNNAREKIANRIPERNKKLEMKVMIQICKVIHGTRLSILTLIFPSSGIGSSYCTHRAENAIQTNYLGF